MTMTFSQRNGYIPVSKVIQYESMNDQLRNSIWNILDSILWGRLYSGLDERETYCRTLWFAYYKLPVDEIPMRSTHVGEFIDWKKTLALIRERYFAYEWHEVYSFLEYTIGYYDDDRLNRAVNSVLETELSGWRCVNGQIVNITNTQEIESIESAITDDDFPYVRDHVRKALERLSDRKSPDYSNSIKESISAVENMAKELSGDQKATLPAALKELERNGKIHPALKDGFIKLYGYTSDADGIRHSLMEESNLTSADAIYFLVSCSAFVNYLKSKV